MERNTFVHYAWIIIMILTLSVVLAVATPFGHYVGDGVVAIITAFRGADRDGIDNMDELEDRWEHELVDPTIDPNPSPDITDDLQEKYEFKYYSSVYLAALDITNEQIGTNADVDREYAVAGIYIMDDNVPCIVLLRDSEEPDSATIGKKAVLNLAGNTLTYKDKLLGLDVYEGLTIDGTTSGSSIIFEHSELGRLIQVRDGDVLINGGSYKTNIKQATANILLANINKNTIIKNANIEFYSDEDNANTIQTKSNVTMDNCTMKIVANGRANAISLFSGSETNIINSTIHSQSNNENSYAVVVNDGTLTVSGSKINSKAESYSHGISSYKNVKISDSVIHSQSNLKANGIFNSENCELEVYNCEISAISNIELVLQNDDGDKIVKKAAYGIHNSGKATIKDSNIKGTFSGIENKDTLNVDGGTYEGHCAGGISFTSGTETSTAYVKNCTLKEMDMPQGYTVTDEKPELDYGVGFCAGIYENETTQIIYMDNCNIYGSKRPISFRNGTTSTTELYISNSIINKNYEHGIGFFSTNNKLYIGTGCNFTIDDTNSRKTSIKNEIPNMVITTNEEYCK